MALLTSFDLSCIWLKWQIIQQWTSLMYCLYSLMSAAMGLRLYLAKIFSYLIAHPGSYLLN